MPEHGNANGSGSHSSFMTPDGLLTALDEASVAVALHRHPAVFTVEESSRLTGDIPGAHTKNLFLKDRKGRLFLVVAPDRAAIDLKRLHERLGASGRFSFGSADLLRSTLGVEPGSVSPLAAVNDRNGLVTVVIDETLARTDRINVHPLVNTMTVGLAPSDLVDFLVRTGHPAMVVALPRADG